MPDVFVNYRTGDEESAATMIARELTRRFGGERIFFASNSIELGHRFPVELVRAVEECQALLAVIARAGRRCGGPTAAPPSKPSRTGPVVRSRPRSTAESW
jgi:hypothetical protein